MKALVEYIAAALVDDPAAVRVRERSGNAPRETKLELRVSERDIGKVIGRQGRTAKAMRSLLAAAGRKVHRSFSLEIQE